RLGVAPRLAGHPRPIPEGDHGTGTRHHGRGCGRSPDFLSDGWRAAPGAWLVRARPDRSGSVAGPGAGGRGGEVSALARFAAPRALLFLLAAPLAAQEQPPAAQEQATDDSVRVAAADSADPDAARLITPRGALIRSLIVPGWGQAYTGSYLRGGIYFAAQMGSWYMLLKTMARLGEARSIERQRVANVRRELLIQAQQDTALQRRYADPAQLDADIAKDERVAHSRKLIGSRT